MACSTTAYSSTGTSTTASVFPSTSASPRSCFGAPGVAGKASIMARIPMRAGQPVPPMQLAKAPRLPSPPPEAAPGQSRRPSCQTINGYTSCKWQTNYGQMGRLS